MCVCNPMEHSPSWEADSHTASQEILCLLWNLKVYYWVHKGLPLVPILTQMHPVHTLTPYFPGRSIVIIFPFTTVFSKWSLSIMFPNQNTACISHLSCPCYMPHQSHFLDLITLIIFGEVYRLQSSLCSLLQPPAASSLFGQTIFFSTLFFSHP